MYDFIEVRNSQKRFDRKPGGWNKKCIAGYNQP